MSLCLALAPLLQQHLAAEPERSVRGRRWPPCRRARWGHTSAPSTGGRSDGRRCPWRGRMDRPGGVARADRRSGHAGGLASVGCRSAMWMITLLASHGPPLGRSRRSPARPRAARRPNWCASPRSVVDAMRDAASLPRRLQRAAHICLRCRSFVGHQHNHRRPRACDRTHACRSDRTAACWRSSAAVACMACTACHSRYMNSGRPLLGSYASRAATAQRRTGRWYSSEWKGFSPFQRGCRGTIAPLRNP